MNRGTDHPRLNNWRPTASYWVSYEPQDGVRQIGTCETCSATCGHNFYSFPEDARGKKQVKPTYGVSNDGQCVVQGLYDEDLAKLLALAPALRDLAAAVVRKAPGTRKRAKALLAQLDEKLETYGYHDPTANADSLDDYLEAWK